MVKCCSHSHCGREADNPRYKTCSLCRQKARAYAASRRQRLLSKNICIKCSKGKADDGFAYCFACRKKERETYAHYHKMQRKVKPKPIRTTSNKKVQMKVEYVRIIEEKAAEVGTTRQDILAELIERYLDKVKVW